MGVARVVLVLCGLRLAAIQKRPEQNQPKATGAKKHPIVRGHVKRQVAYIPSILIPRSEASSISLGRQLRVRRRMDPSSAAPYAQCPASA
jgi:hypothetical protein